MTNYIIAAFVVAALALIFGIVRLRTLSLSTLVFGIIGAVIGLLLGALASVPLGRLPHPYGDLLPVLVSVLLTIIFIPIALSQRHSVLRHIPLLRRLDVGEPSNSTPSILVDTSAIIDGRIADIADAGFVPGKLLIPKFVLAELQNIADSDDAMRRGRGRRGLEVVGRLQEILGTQIEIIDRDVSGVREVDAKLVTVANELGAHVLTTDYNLNRVASIQGVRVLNVNELSNAIRPVVIPGEELRVRVVQPGKEKNQGVGYLPDGTMIVVENGDKLMNQEVSTEVTRVFQTVAGKMIFAAPKKGQLPDQEQAQKHSQKPKEKTEINSEQLDKQKPFQHRANSKQGSKRKSAEDRLIEQVNHQE